MDWWPGHWEEAITKCEIKEMGSTKLGKETVSHQSLSPEVGGAGTLKLQMCETTFNQSITISYLHFSQ